jgi:PAS domain S-box-containing protein
MSSETEPFVAEPADPAADDFRYLAAFQELVLERARDLITVMDPAGTIVYASPSWSTIGWDPDAVVGRPIAEFLHPHNAERAAAALAEIASGRAAADVTLRVRTSDGRWVFVEATSSSITSPGGRTAYVLSTARDVTEREELRNRVAEVNALYRIADAIARSTDLDELLAEAVETLVEATDADRASVLVYDDAKIMRFRAWHGLSDAYRAATEGHAPWSPEEVDPDPLLVRDLETAGFPPEVEDAVRAEGIAALAFVPLVHGGRLVGKFMLYHDEPHEWTEREVLLCRTIANHLASATVRSGALQALRTSSEQLTTIMRTVDEGVVAQSHDGRLVYANEAAARLIGFETVEELLAADRAEVLDRYEILDEHGRPLAAEELPGRRALRGETGERILCYRDRDGGAERWSIVRANPVADVDGAIGLSISVFHDITAARLADAERRRVEERTRFLVRASELLSESLDYEETLEAIAQMAVPSLAGYLVVDLVEDDVSSTRCVAAAHIDPQKTELVRALRLAYPPTRATHPVQRALRTGQPQFLPQLQSQVEEMAQDPEHAAAIRAIDNTSGIVVPLLVRGSTVGAISLGTVAPQPPFDENDVELAVELARRASVALENARLYREAQTRAHAAEALEFVDDGVFLLDRDEIVRLWNPAAAKTLRVRPAKAIGRAMRDLLRDWDSLRERIEVTLEPTAGAKRAQTLPVAVHGEERWLAISGVRFPAGTVYAFRDLTEERAVEELKSDFVSTVSHELRTPLSAIYGAALTLQRQDVRLEESQRTGLLDMIASEADRLARIVNAILWASRLDSGQMGVEIESCDAAKLSRQVVDALRAHAPADVSLAVEAAEGLPPVATDPDKLRQVLTNLVDNAVKYSPDGGAVRVSLSQAGSRIRFRIEDEGLGIPPSEQERIFEKFFRLDPNLTRGVGGTGLGLYICRELVHRMHGRIWVGSDGRRGSTFFVELPVAGQPDLSP